jgi:hypothetical protein
MVVDANKNRLRGETKILIYTSHQPELGNRKMEEVDSS